MSRRLPSVVVVIVLAAIAGCGKPERKLRASGKEIEVAMFMGGYGLDFFKQVARDYERAHRGVKVNLWGDPRVGEKLRPRFLAGDPPDAIWTDMPVWRLASGGALKPLDAALNTRAYGQNMTWRESLLPSALASSRVAGKTYFLPADMSVFMMWYNAGMFRQHGWRPPRTWDEFYDLCEKIKRAGIAPIAFQGRYPNYALPMLFSLFHGKAGGKPLFALFNLAPGAWRHPDLIAAARALRQMVAKGYFQPGCMGMTHTEAQMEFVNSRAAMVPCGTWLKSEMAKSIPAGFEMSCFRFPATPGGKGDPSVVAISSSLWCVPAKAANAQGGMDFLKWLTSLDNASRFAREKDTFFSVKGSDRDISSALRPAADAVRDATYTWPWAVIGWYPDVSRWIDNGLASLMTGAITPEEFCRRIEAAGERARRDLRLPKYHLDLPPGVEP